MMISDLTVRSRIGNYTVHFSEDLGFLRKLGKVPNVALVVDRNVAELYADVLKKAFPASQMYILEATEARKNLGEVQRIYEWVITHFSAKKNLNLISIGGGITQDITGFVASTLFRGVNWVFVPTTLLAQVDSCIGGKSSLNFKSSKNLVGTFYPPREIYIASAFVKTLSDVDMSSGYGEIIKFLLTKYYEKGVDQHIAERIRRMKRSRREILHVVRECLAIKCDFIENDEFDQGRRNLLNYGHCFGHALESASRYYVPHGIAVNVGILFANLAAVARGQMRREDALLLATKIQLPLISQIQRKKDYSGTQLLKNMRNDKKRTGRDLALVFPVKNGLSRVSDFTESEFHTVLNALKDILFPAGKRK